MWTVVAKITCCGSTQLTSVDGITKYTPYLRRMVVYGAHVSVSDETLKNTPYLHTVVMRDINQFPRFYSSMSTLLYVDLGGRAIRCVEEARVDGMSAVQYFRLLHTSISRFPHPGCSNEPYEIARSEVIFSH